MPAEESVKILALLSQQQLRDMERGRKIREGAQRGGRRNPARDLEMAREFNRRRVSGCSVSSSALKAEIGATRGLRRSAAIEAVNRGLQKLRPVSREAHPLGGSRLP